AQRPENTVMQALESLNDSQVNDFLSGKTPLNLSMRLGDHMMLIQLQLSTVNPAGGTTAATAALPPVMSGNSSVGGCSGSTSSSHSASSGALGCIYPSSSVGSHLSHARTRSSSYRLASGRIGNGHVHSHQHPSLQHSHNHYHHHHHHHHNATALAAANAGAPSRKLDQERSGNNKSSCSTTTETTSTSCGSNSNNSSSCLSATAGGSRMADTTAENGRGHHVFKTSDLSSFLSKRDYESLHNIVKSIAPRAAAAAAAAAANQASRQKSAAGVSTVPSKPLVEQSPIKSLSNLVSSSIKTTAIKNIHIAQDSESTSSLPLNIVGSSSTTATSCASGGCQQDPISAKLTSCLCTRLATASVPSVATTPTAGATPLPPLPTTTTAPPPPASTPPPSTAASRTLPNLSQSLGSLSRTSICSGTGSNSGSSCVVENSLHKTVNNPITVTRSKHRHHHHHHHHHHHYHHAALAAAARLKCQEATLTKNGTPTAAAAGTTRTSSTAELDDAGLAVSDTRTLAEASRNLTQTLRKLSKEVFTNKIDLSGGGSMGVGAGIGGGEETPRKSGSGAVIESMKNHGKGIYSGTFSGTLNPALQDRFGRPKRDISTVIHILNDLLSATPQYGRGARISFEAPSGSNTSKSSISNNNGSYSSNNGSPIASSTNTSCGNAAAAKTAAPTSLPVALHNSVRSKLYSNKPHNCAKCKSRAQQQQAAAVLAAGNCAYGECNGHYLAKGGISAGIAGSLKSSTHGCCNDADMSSDGSTSNAAAMDSSNGCMCRIRVASGGGVGLDDGQRDHMCQKCVADLANLKTKSKLDQLRLVMQQRKQKREERKLKSSPYDANAGILTATVEATPQYSAVSALVTTPLPAVKTKHNSNSTATTAAAAAAAAAAATTASPSEVSPNHIVEEVDTAA
ncbi:hypothetical protein AWZ03_014561, partial [Drosophila navojoa]